ncbi:MAG: hypothetical protein PHN69_07280 [Candidatus Pacebacteria bacterium]|nr:hypothetical protein [Candidatus Paceibacterota bacterium]
MSRTWRYCNNKHSPLFEHPFKLLRRHCKCSYCIDPNASKHRRENNKLEIKRELENLSDPELIRFPHFACYNWHYGIFYESWEGCNMENSNVSYREFATIK